jgi:hypothetical protein
VRGFRLSALLIVASSCAFADPILTIDLPLVNGVLTLSGTPGQTVNVQATITTDTPLMITEVDATAQTTEGDDVAIDESVVFFDPNFGNEIPAGTPTTGDLLGITFADIASSTADIVDLQVQYMLSGDQTVHILSVPGTAFEVDTVEEVAPEPSTVALLSFGVAGLIFIQRRKLFA